MAAAGRWRGCEARARSLSRHGTSSRRDVASHRQTASVDTCVPPTQRSIPSSSTRSASPARTRSPISLSRIGTPAKRRPSPSGGGAGRSAPSDVPRRRLGPRPSSDNARKNHASPRNGAGSSSCAATNAAAGVGAPPATVRSTVRSVAERPSAGAGSSSSRRSSAPPRSGIAGVPCTTQPTSASGSGARKASHTAAAVSSASSLTARRPGQSVSSSSAVSSPSPRNAGFPGKASTTIALGATPASWASASTSTSCSWSYRSCSNQRTTGTRSAKVRRSSSSRPSREERIARRLPQPCSERNAARRRSRSRLGTAGTGPAWSTSCHGRTAPPSAVRRSVFAALSPFVTWSTVGGAAASRPLRARYPAPHVQWSSESQAQPTTRASSSRIRRRPAMRSSISSIFDAIRTRSASEGELERRDAQRYSPISASVNPTACASLMARTSRTVSSSYVRCPLGSRSGAGSRPRRS